MKIVVAGSSGLIGSALVESLRADGHDVLRLVRREAKAPSEVQWNPQSGEINRAALDGCSAIINLAGAGVGDHRWSDSYKKLILSSRVDTTSLLAQVAADLNISTLVNASAIGYYGDTADREVTEQSPKGTGFLADVVEAWENAADPARAAGVRVVHPRTGLVMAAEGGAWARMLPLFKFGLGGTLGNGKQYWSFISMRDEIAALKYVLTNEAISGAVNLSAPNPATNREVTKALAQALKRPALFPVPAIALKIVLGEFSTEVLSSSRVLPAVLTQSGFTFADSTITEATATLLAK